MILSTRRQPGLVPANAQAARCGPAWARAARLDSEPEEAGRRAYRAAPSAGGDSTGQAAAAGE
jgi:hypothetical protein